MCALVCARTHCTWINVTKSEYVHAVGVEAVYVLKCFSTCLPLPGDQCQASCRVRLNLTVPTSRCHGINHDAAWRWWQAA